MIATWKSKLKELMAQAESPIRFAASGPTVIMVCGVNGAGKTTSIAKLARMFRSRGQDGRARRRRHVPRRGRRAT